MIVYSNIDIDIIYSEEVDYRELENFLRLTEENEKRQLEANEDIRTLEQ